MILLLLKPNEEKKALAHQEYRSPFAQGWCPNCKQKTLVSSTFVDSCENPDCGYGYLYSSQNYNFSYTSTYPNQYNNNEDKDE